MSFKFERLIIWQKSMDFGEEIHSLSDTFPQKEIYNLTSQIKRAGDSIALNIAEGSILQSNAEFKKFFYTLWLPFWPVLLFPLLFSCCTCFYKEKERISSVPVAQMAWKKTYKMMDKPIIPRVILQKMS